MLGLRSEIAQIKLLSEADLTLARALEIAQAMEVAERQAAQMRVATSVSTMEAVTVDRVTKTAAQDNVTQENAPKATKDKKLLPLWSNKPHTREVVQGLFCSRGLFCSYLLLFCSQGTILLTQFEPTLAGTILFTTTILHVHTSHMHSVHGDYPVHRRHIILFTGDYPVHVNRIVPGEQNSPYYSGDYPVHYSGAILFTGDYLVYRRMSCSRRLFCMFTLAICIQCSWRLSCSQATVLFTATILFTATAAILFTGDYTYSVHSDCSSDCSVHSD